jgi:hypothetical protein
MLSTVDRVLLARASLKPGWVLALDLGKLIGVGLTQKGINRDAAVHIIDAYISASSSKKEFLKLLKFIENHGVILGQDHYVRTTIANSIEHRAVFLDGLSAVLKSYLAYLRYPDKYSDWKNYVVVFNKF